MNLYPQAGFKRYVTTGGADTSGLNQNNNSMAAPLAAAIIPAVASVAGSVINSISGANANKANVAMQRETNELNYRMFKEQNAWNLAQWNRENEYNSPEQQALRLQRAGINPAYVFGNGSVSEASALQSASPNPAQSPRVEPIQYGQMLADGAYTAINAYNQSQLMNAQTDEVRQRAHGLNVDNLLKEFTLENQIKMSNLDADQKQLYTDILRSTKNAKIAVENGNVRQQEESIKLMVQQQASMKIHSEVEQKLADSNVKVNDAQIKVLNKTVDKLSHEIAYIDAQRDLTQQQKLNLIIAKIGMEYDNISKEVGAQVAKQAQQATVGLVNEQYKQAKQGTYYAPATPLTPWLQMPKSTYFPAGYSVP